MQRLLLPCLLAGAMVVTVAVPGMAAPERGNSAFELDLECDGPDVTILVQFFTGSAAVFELAEGNGRQYVLSYVFETIDTPDGALTYEKTWGQRKGYSEELTCSGEAEFDWPGGGTATAEFDVVLAGK